MLPQEDCKKSLLKAKAENGGILYGGQKEV